MVLLDPKSTIIKELDFEKSAEEDLFPLEHAACVLCRLTAARSLAKQGDEAGVKKALSSAWKKEKSGTARMDLVTLLAGGEEAFGRRRMRRPGGSPDPAPRIDESYRPALREAAKDPEARVRVAA